MISRAKSTVLAAAAAALFSAAAVGSPVDVPTLVAEKNEATTLFLKSNDVRAALKTLQDQGYVVADITAATINFFMTDEGPAGKYLVTASLGKSADFGWTTKLVTAVVDTDDFGAHSAKLVDADKVRQALEQL